LGLSYNSSVPVQPPSTGRTLGTTTVIVNFSAPAPASPAAASGVVGMSVAVLDWPWVQPTDELALAMPLWPQNTSLAHLAGSNGTANTIQCLSPSASAPLESFTWEMNATSGAGAQSSHTLQVATHLSGDPTFTTVEVVFTGGAGGYSALHYDPLVSVPVPPFAPAPSVGEYAALLGVGAIAALVGVLGLRSVWNRPPSLEVVPEPRR
jgi:hypothetical protein